MSLFLCHINAQINAKLELNAYTQDCEKEGNCCKRKKKQTCKPCCYLEVIGGGHVKEGKIKPARDLNAVPKVDEPGCNGLGKYTLTAKVKMFHLTGKDFAEELKKLYDNKDKKVTCETGCKLGKDVNKDFIGPHVPIMDDESDAPAWWTQADLILDEVSNKTRVAWSCCGNNNWQTVHFHDNTWYWIPGGAAEIEPKPSWP